MTISLRQRSPLGAPFRSPLGVLGPGTAGPPVMTAWRGTVNALTQEIDLNTSGAGFGGLAWFVDASLGNCGAFSIETNNTGGAFQTAWWLVIDLTQIAAPAPDPDGYDWSGWRFVGQTSGAEWIAGTDTPTQECQRTQGLNYYETLWADVFASPGIPLAPAPIESSLYFKGSGSQRRIENAQHVADRGFTIGETVDIFES